MRKLIAGFILVSFIPLANGQSVPKKTGSQVTQEDAIKALEFHNKVRKDVGSPALEWSTELASYAQAWADNLVKNNNCKPQHRPHDGKWKQQHGENIFWGMGAAYDPLAASQSWYDEIKDYQHGPIVRSNGPVTGHYTQMVWKKTTHVGIAIATCPDGLIIVVGNYSPAGNFLGETAY